MRAAVALSHEVSLAVAARPTMAPAATAAIQSNGANSARVRLSVDHRYQSTEFLLRDGLRPHTATHIDVPDLKIRACGRDIRSITNGTDIPLFWVIAPILSRAP